MTRTAVPQPTRPEQAARDAACWWPGDKPPRARDRSPRWLAYTVILALAAASWGCLVAAGDIIMAWLS